VPLEVTVRSSSGAGARRLLTVSRTFPAPVRHCRRPILGHAVASGPHRLWTAGLRGHLRRSRCGGGRGQRARGPRQGRRGRGGVVRSAARSGLRHPCSASSPWSWWPSLTSSCVARSGQGTRRGPGHDGAWPSPSSHRSPPGQRREPSSPGRRSAPPTSRSGGWCRRLRSTGHGGAARPMHGSQLTTGRRPTGRPMSRASPHPMHG
jgi:hypothetical protein